MKTADPGHLFYNPHFEKDERYIGPGEWYVSGEDLIISTVLGSCVSVALYNSELKIGGINHFMLPKHAHDKPAGNDNETSGGFYVGSAKYGVYAMELLINALIKAGVPRASLRAKVFGGSRVLGQFGLTGNISRQNSDFAFRFLRDEKIPIDAYSVGGLLPRRIYFFPRTSKVLLKYSFGGETSQALREERLYSHKIEEQRAGDGKAVLF